MNPNIALSSFHECFDTIAQFAKLDLVQRPTMRGVMSGISHPIFNYVYDFRLDDLTAFEDDLKYFRDLGTPYFIVLLESDVHKIHNVLEEYDFKFNAFAQGLTTSLDEHEHADNHTDIEVRLVETEPDLIAFDEISSEGFHHPKGLLFKYARPLLDTKPEQIKMYLALINNEPVGQGILFIGQEDAGCYWSSVRKTARGLGVHRKLIEVRLNEAKKQGCKNIVVQAYGTHYQNFACRGFKELGRLATFYTTHGH